MVVFHLCFFYLYFILCALSELYTVLFYFYYLANNQRVIFYFDD